MQDRSVIILTHEFPPKRGGAGTYCEELLHACKQIGLNAEAWVPKYGQETAEGKVVSLPIKGSQSWSCSFRSIRETRKRLNAKTDQVVLHLAEAGSLRAFIRFGWMLKENTKFLATIHGSELLKFCSNPLEKFLFRRLLRKAEKIHVLSAFNKNALLSLFPELETKVFLFPGAPARRLVGRQKASSPLGQKVKILCVGRIHPRKGQDLLLEAIVKLPQTLSSKLECLLVGPVVDKRFYEKLRGLSKIANCSVFFLGDLDDVDLKAVYQETDLFVMPSIQAKKSIEGFGFVYLEAGSHGLPVIAHRTGGVEDAVLDQKTGLLIDPKDPKGLCEAIRRLIEDPEQRLRMGEEGANWAKSRTWEELAGKIYNLP